ncbi:PREDICTED: protein CWC15 homolog [Camelina sativa]|uniref:Protein CWC15 homolog n=1 Tax=Camelina sativa TaxID=90675 RepID=A0ABM1QZJ2_CAMSA|nr:PREDICTED: protein CWC15 homolog [Camelina sativa]
MTTAARPTWPPAKGGNEQGGARIFGPSQKYSSRDVAAHTTLKPRDHEDGIIPRSVDADDSHVDNKNNDESDDDDEDDTEALMAKLDQIKKERVEERLRKVF